jgi:hypothetical protein
MIQPGSGYYPFHSQPAYRNNVAPSRRLAAIFAGGERTGLLQEQAPVLATLAGLDLKTQLVHHLKKNRRHIAW